MIPRRAEIVIALDPMENVRFGNGIGAGGLYINGNRAGHPDGVAQLDLAAVGSARLHYGLGNISCHIRRGTVHLGGILTAEGAAAVPGIAAIGIH